MDKIKLIGGALALAVISFSVGKFSSPAKIQVKEVEKIVYKEKTDTKKSYTKKEFINADGSRTIETVLNTDKKTDTSQDTETKKETVTDNRPSLHVSLIYQPSVNGIQTYALDIQKRLFSELYLGAYVSTQNAYGISIGLGF